MKKIVLTSIVVFTLQSCEEGNETTAIDKDTVVTIDTTKTSKYTIATELKSDTLQSLNTPPQKGKPVINDKILGFWALVGDENARFEIKKDKMFYPEFSKSYQYKIVGDDSIEIKYDDYKDRFAVKMRGMDTLLLTGDETQTI